MTLALTDQGLQTSTKQEIVDDLVARLRAVFGSNLRTDLKSIMGQLVQIMSELRALDQQALLAVYRSFDPNGAIGTTLSARVGLTGTIRKGEDFSVVEGVLTFSAAGTMAQGDLIKNVDNDTVWALTDGPHTSAGPWPEEIPAQFTCQEAGPVLAQAGTTWEAVTTVANLDGFTNPTDDAEPGRLQEPDGDLRPRRIIELHSQGQGPLLAITGVVSKVPGVESVRVYDNPETQPIDANGIPFKAVNVVVETSPAVPTAALQQAIWNAIWTGLGGGGHAYGTDYVGTVVDDEGREHTVAFDVVSEIDVVIEVDLITSTSEDPVTANITSVVADEIASVMQDRYEVVGRDVRALDIEGIVAAMLVAGTLSGVDGVTVRLARDPDSPAEVEKLSISARERADFDSGNISVNTT